MATLSNLSRRIALASAVSLLTIACSPMNAQSDMQDSAALQDMENDKAPEKKGVFIVKRGDRGKDGKSVDVRVVRVDTEGEKHHKIKIKRKTVGDKITTEVEGGELTKDDDGNEVVIYTDDDGKTHEFKIDEKSNHRVMKADKASRVWVQEPRKPRELRVTRELRVVRAPRMHEMMRSEMERANVEMEKARTELRTALEGVDKELADVKDKDTAEYEGLKIAKTAIKSAMNSLKAQRFDKKKMQIEFRKMDKEVVRHLETAVENLDEQNEAIIELQVELQGEMDEAREEMRTMVIEIEEDGDEESRHIRLKAVEDMEGAMGNMAEYKLKALKKAEEDLRKTRIDLEKQIAEKKAKVKENEKSSSEGAVKDKK